MLGSARLRSFIAIAVTVGVLLGTTATVAATSPVPVDLRAAIFLRALAYERGLGSGSGNVEVGIVADPADAPDARAMASSLGDLRQAVRVGRRPVHVTRYGFQAQTAAELRSNRVDVVYLASGLGRDAARAVEARGRVVLCADKGLVGSGCMLSVEVHQQRPRLIVDLPRVERAGLRFDARLLRLARVVR